MTESFINGLIHSHFMAEQDVNNYMRKCTAILLQKMDHLETKIYKLELLMTPERKFIFFTTKRWLNLLKANENIEKRIDHRLEQLRQEFHETLKRTGY